jgi:hypothetical protein
MCVRLLYHLLHLLGLRHVKSEGKNSVAETFREIGNVSQFASGSGDLVAALQSGFSPDAAETARGTGDKPCLLHIDSPVVESVCSRARRKN